MSDRSLIDSPLFRKLHIKTPQKFNYHRAEIEISHIRKFALWAQDAERLFKRRVMIECSVTAILTECNRPVEPSSFGQCLCRWESRWPAVARLRDRDTREPWSRVRIRLKKEQQRCRKKTTIKMSGTISTEDLRMADVSRVSVLWLLQW